MHRSGLRDGSAAGGRRPHGGYARYVLVACALAGAFFLLAPSVETHPEVDDPEVRVATPGQTERDPDPTATATADPPQKPVNASQELEVVREDESVDGVDRETQRNPESSGANAFITRVAWQGKCWYKVENFCVVNGQLTFYHDPAQNVSSKGKLRMCNEFSQHSPSIQLGYHSHPLPSVLPGPVLTRTKGWVLQFWCQDLFHMTLTMMPAYATMPHVGPHPDIYVRIAKGVRKGKDQMCRVKLGDPHDFEKVQNPKWGGDRQFPFPGNPYWPLYKLLTPDPHRLLPLYRGATKKTVCYRHGVIDKLYVKDIDGETARRYSDAQLQSMGVVKGPTRRCGSYRLTFIDRRGRTRRINNTAEVVETARGMGFAVQAVALEHLPIRDQLRLMTETDVLVGVHGNGLTWLQFLPIGSVVIELVGVWYMPYSLLFGHSYLHSSMKNNPYYKAHGEFVPFPANVTELAELLRSARAALDATSCSNTTTLRPRRERLELLYRNCTPNC